jgi:D-alanyl-D-alanine carboxypeptidase
MTSEITRRGVLAGVGTSFLLAVSGCAVASGAKPASSPAPKVTHTPAAMMRPTPTPAPTPTFDRAQYSLTDPTSTWVVVNKQHPLNPLTYVPPDLVQPDLPNVNGQPVRQVVAGALEQVFAAAQQAGLHLTVQSGYRSYQTQVDVYRDDVAQNGQQYADTDTARPGYSEHQTGLAVDISPASGNCALDACMGQTPEGEWLAATVWQYGFLLRYPADKVPVTGFTYEPWHFRYVGTQLSTELHTAGIETLEEFFGIPGGQAYPG